MTLAEVNAAIDSLRSRGVKFYEDIAGGGFKVEFFAGTEPSKPATKRADDELCRCGHHKDDEHVNGLCIKAGCDPTACSPPEAK